ncbi:murein transglycosylase A [Shewanella sp. JM162201]|uniref:Membrane-bound lytic murein transglycosylase A n=1 Tax=Shewanella jiangmenensis TaxID=2837387 RepID=A0ABS5V007_9GAMM|nr:murein transglycosylase A [Shewanella jiangmenensis]MBT1443811.1 murein transglycosylase A [Shewanella jiangmenensis]
MGITRRLPLLACAAALLFGCSSSAPKPAKPQPVTPVAAPVFEYPLGHQYLDGFFPAELNPVPAVNSHAPRNFSTFEAQSRLVLERSPRLANRYAGLYQKLQHWLAAGANPMLLGHYGIRLDQLGGGDRQGNVMFTGYFSPVLEVRHKPDDKFRYPLYAMPRCKGRCPSRADIHRGALKGKKLELAYSDSLMDTFLLEVQGSGFIHYGDDDSLNYLGYAGKNGHGYTSIGRVLIDRGEVSKEQMSLRAIKKWAEDKSEAEVKELLETNPSYVFFKRAPNLDVLGSAGIPLLPMAAVAADKRLLPMGTPILAEVPLLDKEGNWTGKHELRLLIALDTGGAVKGGHLDLYHGMGSEAGVEAGHYKHFGRVWRLGAMGMAPVSGVK